MDKTLARVQERIEAEQYYDAHQAVRTVIARYVRQKDFENAYATLYSCCILLGRAEQAGSVADLILYLLKLYTQNKQPVDGVSKGRVAQLVYMLPPSEPAIRQLAHQAEVWVTKVMDAPGGDSELHLVFGTVFARAGRLQDAENHLLQGPQAAAYALAQLHCDSYKLTKTPESIVAYVSRGVFGYLSTLNFLNCHLYLERVLEDLKSLGYESTMQGKVAVFEGSLQLMTFLQLLVLVLQKKEPVIYEQLINQYKARQVPGWAVPLGALERVYFGTSPSKNGGLMNLMGMF